MPHSTQNYGIDSLVFVRLLTGHPEEDFEKTSTVIESILEENPSCELFVSNQVIGESYITLQFHYGITKPDARDAIHQMLINGVVSPLNGQKVLEILKDNSGAGLVDRLIVQDYETSGYRILTNDKKLARLPNCQLLT